MRQRNKSAYFWSHIKIVSFFCCCFFFQLLWNCTISTLIQIVYFIISTKKSNFCLVVRLGKFIFVSYGHKKKPFKLLFSKLKTFQMFSHLFLGPFPTWRIVNALYAVDFFGLQINDCFLSINLLLENVVIPYHQYFTLCQTVRNSINKLHAIFVNFKVNENKPHSIILLFFLTQKYVDIFDFSFYLLNMNHFPFVF